MLEQGFDFDGRAVNFVEPLSWTEFDGVIQSQMASIKDIEAEQRDWSLDSAIQNVQTTVDKIGTDLGKLQKTADNIANIASDTRVHVLANAQMLQGLQSSMHRLIPKINQMSAEVDAINDKFKPGGPGFGTVRMSDQCL